MDDIEFFLFKKSARDEYTLAEQMSKFSDIWENTKVAETLRLFALIAYGYKAVELRDRAACLKIVQESNKLFKIAESAVLAKSLRKNRSHLIVSSIFVSTHVGITLHDREFLKTIFDRFANFRNSFDPAPEKICLLTSFPHLPKLTMLHALNQASQDQIAPGALRADFDFVVRSLKKCMTMLPTDPGAVPDNTEFLAAVPLAISYMRDVYPKLDGSDGAAVWSNLVQHKLEGKITHLPPKLRPGYLADLCATYGLPEQSLQADRGGTR